MPLEHVAALKRVELLKPLDDAALMKVGLACTWINASKGQQILTVQDESTEVYFIVSGKVQVSLYSTGGQRVVFTSLSNGDSFGELAAIDGLPRSATVEAQAPSKLASLSAQDFQNLIQSEPVFSLMLMRRLALQVRRLSDRIYEFSTLDVCNRIQVELLRQARLVCNGSDQAVLIPAPSPTQMASTLSMNRGAISREVTRLADMGIVRRERGKLRFLSLKKLSDLIEKEQSGD